MIMNQCSDPLLPRQWSDLPRDILVQVADLLPLIDLLNFRFVCKDFLYASSTATARIEYFPRFLLYDRFTLRIESWPWFLVYGQGSRCHLLSYGDNNCTKIHTLNLPRLQGAICLASSQGWLLVFRKGSMFFYCPFSDVKIVLPNFPRAKLTGYHTAAFSCPIWSKDCVIAVINRTDDYLELNVLIFGGNWVTSKFKHEEFKFKHGYFKHEEQDLDDEEDLDDEQDLDVTRGAAYHGGLFYFLNRYGQGITYCPKRNELTTYFHGRNKEFIIDPDLRRVSTHVPHPSSKYEVVFGLGKEVALGYCNSFVRQMRVRKLIKGLEDASISTCGTLMHFNNTPIVIYNQYVRGNSSSRFKGVCIQPRFYDLQCSEQQYSSDDLRGGEVWIHPKFYKVRRFTIQKLV